MNNLEDFQRNRPIIATLIEKFKPEILEPSVFETKFKEDLKVAKTDVLIMSPFITSKRISDLEDILRYYQ